MHFTQALTVALSLSAAAVMAAPAPIVRGSQEDSSKLMLRSVHESQIAARGFGINDAVSSTPLQARGLDSVSHLRRAMDLQYKNLDQLVAAIRDLIITLLGKGGGTMSRRQDNTAQLEQAIQQVTCILDALFGNTDESCSEILGSSANSTNATSTLTNSTRSPFEKKLSALGTKLRNGTSITQVVNDMMLHNAEAAAAAPGSKKADNKKADKKGEKGQKDKHHSAKNATSAADTKTTAAAQKEKRSLELLEARQDSGVQGLLVALRDVVDTILNTLLPMASRGENDDTSTTSERYPPKPCPPPGTPNDGMYRSGCPGYGRRDLSVRRSMQELGERDANILQTMFPMIEMLLRQLPALIQSMASSPTSAASGAAATATSVGGAKAASPTNMVDDAFSQIISALSGSGSKNSSSGSKAAVSASASAAKAQATGTAATDAASAARSAANLSQNFARDLLNGDGMNLGKRQTTGADDGVDGVGSENCDASGNSGGVNVNNLLNGLLSGFSRRSEEYVPLEFFKRQTDGTDGNTIGSGNCAASNNTGGINLSLLDNLLNGLLSGFGRRDIGADGMVPVEVLQRDVATEPLAARSAPESILQERADFAPVWQEIKKIGNEHFHIARDLTHTAADNESTASAAKRSASDNDTPDFTPVWEAFRDLVDSGYDQAAAASGAQRRDAGAPLKLDYKPLMKAGINFGKQMFKSFTSGHAKRSADYKPFVDAASNFSATAIKEMFVKSN
ncbi:hypothetical protein NDA16_003064 [Ustilago loliicola]|nr:hypothetical protein NDA16_003064 [Ustilago loliicola]